MSWNALASMFEFADWMSLGHQAAVCIEWKNLSELALETVARHIVPRLPWNSLEVVDTQEQKLVAAAIYNFGEIDFREFRKVARFQLWLLKEQRGRCSVDVAEILRCLLQSTHTGLHGSRFEHALIPRDYDVKFSCEQIVLICHVWPLYCGTEKEHFCFGNLKAVLEEVALT